MDTRLSESELAALRDHLRTARFTTDAVLERIGEAGQAGLGRNTTVPAECALGDADDPQAMLIRLFLLQAGAPRKAVDAALDVPRLIAAGILEADGDQIRAAVDVRPYGSPDDEASGFLVSDLMPGMNAMTTPTRPDYVLGASPASLTLTQLTMRTPVESVLDLGTGCGVQALHLARHCEKIVATDLNGRALDLARLTARLSDVTVDFREGSLFEPVAGERFDLIVSNPPYVMSPPSVEADRLIYREGNFRADGLVEAIVRGAPAHLAPGGSLQLLTNWAIVENQPWEERLRSWVADSGLDCWVIERERLDRFAYIELWLTDAGLAGSKRWRPAYDAWIAYFEGLGITDVAMGWILLTAAERDVPDLRFEAWPHAVAQPVGNVFARHRAAVDASRLPLADLLAAQPRLVDVGQETMGEPGAADPAHVILRQRSGLLRAIRVGTVEGAVLGALDGELTLGQVIAAVAKVLDLDVTAVAAEVIPGIRDALRDQFLHLRQ